MAIIYGPSGGRWIGNRRRNDFLPLSLIGGHWSKKTENESSCAACVDGKARDKGQRRDFLFASHTEYEEEMHHLRCRFRKAIMTRS